ncbi:hypothetical protein Ddc_17386 [Ditylenchus destructor]|nr:hypothetical protein Ddc_17386 [Ditylenchus destructor]
MLRSCLILLSFVLLSECAPTSDPDESGPGRGGAPSGVNDENSGPASRRQQSEERPHNQSDGTDSENEETGETDEEQDTDEEDGTDEDHSDDDHSALGNGSPNWPSNVPGGLNVPGGVKLPCVDRLNPTTGANDCQRSIQNCNPAYLGGIWISVMKQECPKACKDAGFAIFDTIIVAKEKYFGPKIGLVARKMKVEFVCFTLAVLFLSLSITLPLIESTSTEESSGSLTRDTSEEDSGGDDESEDEHHGGDASDTDEEEDEEDESSEKSSSEESRRSFIGPKLPCVDRLNPRTGVSDCQANIQNCNPAYMGGIWIIVMKQECPKACKDAGFPIHDPSAVDC